MEIKKQAESSPGNNNRQAQYLLLHIHQCIPKLLIVYLGNMYADIFRNTKIQKYMGE